MVGQDRLELVETLGLEQPLDRARRELGEGCVSGREDRERPWTLERVHQPGGLDCGHQRRERARGNGRVDDVALGHGIGTAVHGRGCCASGAQAQQGAEWSKEEGAGRDTSLHDDLLLSWCVSGLVRLAGTPQPWIRKPSDRLLIQMSRVRILLRPILFFFTARQAAAAQTVRCS